MRRPNAYERAINKLWQDIIVVGEEVINLLDFTMDVLIRQDKEKAGRIFSLEDKIDYMEEDIEMRALELIAIQQPITKELRKLAGIMKIVNNLESIADYAVSITELAVKLSDTGQYFKPLVDIPKMCDMTKKMIKNALRAYSEENTELAMEVIESNKEVDKIFDLLYDELIDFMKSDSNIVEQASYLSFVSRYLEKIGEHVENIAEMVNFMVIGSKRVYCNLPD
jgi:phosphate transport system protein